MTYPLNVSTAATRCARHPHPARAAGRGGLVKVGRRGAGQGSRELLVATGIVSERTQRSGSGSGECERTPAIFPAYPRGAQRHPWLLVDACPRPNPNAKMPPKGSARLRALFQSGAKGRSDLSFRPIPGMSRPSNCTLDDCWVKNRGAPVSRSLGRLGSPTGTTHHALRARTEEF